MMREDKIAAALAALPLELERIKDTLSTGLRESNNAVPLQGARYVGVGTAGGRTMAWGGSGRLVGWSLRATGGPVTVVLRDSRTDTGDVIAYVELTDASSDTQWFGPGGISFGEGLYVQAIAPGAGVIQGAVWLGAVD